MQRTLARYRTCATALALAAVVAASSGCSRGTSPVLPSTASPAEAGLAERVVPDAVALHQAAFASALPPSTPMSLQIVLPMRNLPQLRSLLDESIYNPMSAGYHQYLSVAEFTERFGPAQSDYAAAMRFFTENGLRVTHTSANRYLFQVDGSASVVERVLHVKLNRYRDPSANRTFMSPDREPTPALRVRLLSIVGLDDYILPYPKYEIGRDDARSTTGSGPKGSFIGTDFRTAYYGKGSAATLDGTGQSLGLMELAPYLPSDIALYFSTLKKPLVVPINPVLVDGTKAICSKKCDDGEQSIDVEYSISMAPRLHQVQVYVGHDPVAIENAMASDDTSKTLSTSWGYAPRFGVEDPIYQEMAAQGQSWFTASGDYVTLHKSGPWPEEDANITAVGGTGLITDGPGGPWKAERAWQYSASGPSRDKHIFIEPYQLPYINALNGGSTTLRNVSDVSAIAENLFGCAGEGCSGGVYGTSCAAPIWAGFTALANQRAASEGKPPAGFVNPALYGAYRGDKTILHDVFGGRSGKFPAIRGYDLVGGLGTPNGDATIEALIGK